MLASTALTHPHSPHCKVFWDIALSSFSTVTDCTLGVLQEPNLFTQNKTVLICQNTTVAHNHQHPSMTTCFGLL
jgi:hypothetical protein